MKEVLTLIEQKKQEFAQLPLFEFMQDKSIDPRQRLAFAPCVAPFIMSFADLNKYVLREEPTNSVVQALINQHTYEENDHWRWFLEDIEKLGFDHSLNFNDSLKFLWSKETKTSRWVAHQIYRYTFQADPIDKLIVLEVIEATSNVMFSVSTGVTCELRAITQKEYRYFGDFHFAAENSHATCSNDVERFIEQIQLTEEIQKEAFELVEKIFELFTELTNELLAYAKTHDISQPYTNTRYVEQHLKAA